MLNGMVIAAHRAAAEAGKTALAHGGSAMDAAVAAAFALTVVDPANCGLGGYGGFLVAHKRSSQEVIQVDFNTDVPEKFDLECFKEANRIGPFAHGGPAVSVPAVVPGLATAHTRFGELAFSEVLQTAIDLAREGFTIGTDLARSLAATPRERMSTEFKSIFFRDGRPLKTGELLVQLELADTLEYVAAEGPSVFREGPLVDAVCACVSSERGSLVPDDFVRKNIGTSTAEQTQYKDVVVHGPHKEKSGYGILAHALENLDGYELGSNRGPRYISKIFEALRSAWEYRSKMARNVLSGNQHTSHLCAADGEGLLVSLTFTHGPLWFGSGIVVPGTGILLNAGANLFARSNTDDTLFPLTNLTPTIVEHDSGTRHALGSPGGFRIPAIVLQAIVDVVCYDLPLSEALRGPRFSVDPDGNLEAEPALATNTLEARHVEREEYYGPASGISLSPSSPPQAACDPRFVCEVSTI